MWTAILVHAWQHGTLAAEALAGAAALGALLGTAAYAVGWLRGALLAVAAIGRTIPSIAVLMLVLPVLGVGRLPALVALVALALPPIVINVDLALRGVPAAALDAGAGLGMTAPQRFARISIPLALPVALSGVRTAAVEVIASATLATFVGAGGLGDDIVRALQTNDPRLLAAATLAVAALAFLAEFGFTRLTARVTVRA